MENYLMLNGKRIDLTAEQIETLVGKKEKDPFERTEKGNTYYCLDYNLEADFVTECHSEEDDMAFAVGNYCTDKELMEQRALHVILNQQLWRYSMQHGGREIYWSDNKTAKWQFYKNHQEDNYYIESNQYMQSVGAAYFATEGVAKSAIEEIVKPFMEQHPEFRW